MNFNQYLELNEQLNIKGIPGAFMDWIEPQWINKKTDQYYPKFTIKYNPRQMAREYGWDEREIMKYLRQLGCKVKMDTANSGASEVVIYVETPEVPD